MPGSSVTDGAAAAGRLLPAAALRPYRVRKDRQLYRPPQPSGGRSPGGSPAPPIRPPPSPTSTTTRRAQRILHPVDGGVAFIQADVRDPAAVLADPDLAKVINLAGQ